MLCVAAVATVVFQRLRQPVVFGYLLAGMIIGPEIPIPLVADPQTVRALSELGVILLMFALGLEFSVRKLVQVSQKAGAVALFECSVMVSVGYLVGQMLGFTRVESIFAGAIVGISSTTIIVKAFEEQKVRGRVTELVFGILIIEDLIAIFLLTVLTTIARSGTISPSDQSLSGPPCVRLGGTSTPGPKPPFGPPRKFVVPPSSGRASALLWQPALTFRQILTVVAALEFFGGFFIVPISAILQHRPDKERKGVLLAAANLLSFVGALGSGLVYGLLTAGLKLGPRDVFGEMAVLDSEPRTATVTTLKDAVLLKIARDDFRDVLQERPDIGMGVIKVLSRRLRDASRR